MSLDPGTVDMRSMSALRQAFRSAGEPALDDLVGAHAGEFGGPRLLLAILPRALGVLGMPGWYGKRFERVLGDTYQAVGVNLVLRSGQIRDSIAMTARLGPSRVDGRPALLVAYPAEAPFPWAMVADELRPLDDRTLIALNFAIPRIPLGLPFVLRRMD
jgi:hypothetical protein